MGIYNVNSSDRRQIFQVRVRSQDARRITDLLTDNDFKDISIHP
jgi:hypothetical protein